MCHFYQTIECVFIKVYEQPSFLSILSKRRFLKKCSSFSHSQKEEKVRDFLGGYKSVGRGGFLVIAPSILPQITSSRQDIPCLTWKSHYHQNKKNKRKTPLSVLLFNTNLFHVNPSLFNSSIVEAAYFSC